MTQCLSSVHMSVCVCVTDEWEASWWLGVPPVWGCHWQTSQSVVRCLERGGTSICSWCALNSASSSTVSLSSWSVIQSLTVSLQVNFDSHKLVAVVTVTSRLFSYYFCILDDDHCETDASVDRKSPLGFFSKFWELQVGRIFCNIWSFEGKCSFNYSTLGV